MLVMAQAEFECLLTHQGAQNTINGLARTATKEVRDHLAGASTSDTCSVTCAVAIGQATRQWISLWQQLMVAFVDGTQASTMQGTDRYQTITTACRVKHDPRRREFVVWLQEGPCPAYLARSFTE